MGDGPLQRCVPFWFHPLSLIFLAEYNNVSLLLWYWPSVHVVPEWAIIILFWLLILGFAFLGVRAYGEAEYWCATHSLLATQLTFLAHRLTAIKVLAITIFFVVALMIDVGGIG